jgi:ferredoxin
MDDSPGPLRVLLSTIKFGYLRHVIQTQIFILVLYSMTEHDLPVNVLWRIDPVLSISAAVAGHIFPLRFLFISSLFLLASLIFGRAYCGWICPLGFVQDMISSAKSLIQRTGTGMKVLYEFSHPGSSVHLVIGRGKDDVIGHVLYKKAESSMHGLLGDLGTGRSGEIMQINEIWLTSAYRGRLEGKVLEFAEKFARSREFTHIVAQPSRHGEITLYRNSGYGESPQGTYYHPLGGRFQTPEVFRFAKYALLIGGLMTSVAAGWTFLEWLTPMSVLPRALSPLWGIIEGTIMGISILILVVLLAIMEKRWWCRYICPLGAILSLPSARKILGVRLDEKKCIRCLKCERACTMGIIDVRGQSGLRWDSECISCLACRDVCPADAIGLNWT